MNKDGKIILPGGAGLVGQNLVARLRAEGFNNIVVIDKHEANLEILKQVQPEIIVELADLAVPGNWSKHFVGAEVVVMLQAQIGGNDYQEFKRNNIEASEHILDEMKENAVPYLIHISSSVVESMASDFYTETKKAQERLVLEKNIPGPVLRPTLMFGWFDRKHLGWLSRFMKKVPLFPIPGSGKYMRQPLYVGDFCNIIVNCIKNQDRSGVYNISGLEKIDYIEIIREIKRVNQCTTPIVKIPYPLFYAMLWAWSSFDRNPPFTTHQLKALTVKEEFEIIDWPSIFGTSATPFKAAISETFQDPKYSGVTLEF